MNTYCASFFAPFSIEFVMIFRILDKMVIEHQRRVQDTEISNTKLAAGDQNREDQLL